MRPGCMVDLVADVSGIRAEGDVGNLVTPEVLINFAFRFDIIQQHPPGVLQEDTFASLDIVSN